MAVSSTRPNVRPDEEVAVDLLGVAVEIFGAAMDEHVVPVDIEVATIIVVQRPHCVVVIHKEVMFDRPELRHLRWVAV